MTKSLFAYIFISISFSLLVRGFFVHNLFLIGGNMFNILVWTHIAISEFKKKHKN